MPLDGRFPAWALLAGLAIGALACGRADPGERTYEFEACGERFAAVLHDQDAFRRAETSLSTGGGALVVGIVASGDGGFNAPWSWHLTPDTTKIVEGAVEVCDACPSFIEADLVSWVDRRREWCPWSARVVARLR